MLRMTCVGDDTGREARVAGRADARKLATHDQCACYTACITPREGPTLVMSCVHKLLDSEGLLYSVA